MAALFGPVGVVVGLTAEARYAAPLGGRIQIGGGTAAGAEVAVSRLLETGVGALLSFGLAGGLDPALRPGTVIVPETVVVPRATTSRGDRGAERFAVNPDLASRLGGSTRQLLLAGDAIIVGTEEKRKLRAATGTAAVDLESGAVALAAARFGLPFAVLRVICDAADRALPDAALAALDTGGGIRGLRVLASLIRQPRQIPTLLALASDAAAARRALNERVASIGQISTSS